ncbi:ser/Thr protein phosphatase-like protein superfamily [Xylogone sp. PMI_703]|nr:ser/Thr protein phosphatase-like protein superfamily [Xylogone sp. PMI_703]
MNKINSLIGKSSSFQILSDLHLEVGQQYSSFKIPASAPYLILAGDTGRLIDYDPYLAFLATQTAQFEKVFLILGNHEFYNLSFTAGLEQAQKLEQEEVLNGRLVLLHRKRFNIPNSKTTILGCTLWSEIPENARKVVQMKVKDFEKINTWTVDNHNEAHKLDLTWLNEQIAEIQQRNRSRPKGEQKRNILVVTHHAPCVEGTSSPGNMRNPWSSAFATDLLKDGDWKDVKAWVFGHTHFTTEFETYGIRVFSNQRGYVLPGMEEQGDLRKHAKKDKKVFSTTNVISI